ncbi:hypothetical protein [Actinomadura monticuli]|uniref:Uncharacterized protein n=1 Tax=Actinomadura monticuli TaxID=3097367 RepID=A0ABV4Q2J7_9ACTN
MPQGLRRLGSASAAVSVGALVLVLAAPAADAAETCKKGVDPESTIENWKCNLGNLREALTPPSPTPTPTPTPKKTTQNTTKKTTQNTRTAPAKAPRRPASAPSGGQGTGPSAMTGGAGLKPYTGGAPSAASGLPGVLPTPEIAADPNAYRNASAAMPQTRLISPVAASGSGGDQMLLVAAAAGAAGAVGALNISVAGRALRRRRTR